MQTWDLFKVRRQLRRDEGRWCPVSAAETASADVSPDYKSGTIWFAPVGYFLVIAIQIAFSGDHFHLLRLYWFLADRYNNRCAYATTLRPFVVCNVCIVAKEQCVLPKNRQKKQTGNTYGESNGHMTDNVRHMTLKAKGHDPCLPGPDISKTAGDI